MPDIVDLMEEFNHLLEERESKQILRMGRAWKDEMSRLGLRIQQLAEDIANRRANGLAVSRTSITHLETYNSLLKQIAAASKNFESAATSMIKDEQLAYGELGIKAAQATIRSASTGIRFDRLSIKAIQNMVGITADGSPLFDVLTKRAIAPEMVSGMTNALIDAIATGKNPVKTAQLMADGLNGGLAKALTIARTEQIRVYRQATIDQYKESGVVKEWQRHAALQEKTCLTCLALDGKIQSTSEIFASHPNCRCFTTPVIDGVALPARLSGQDWLAAQKFETQQKILGGHYDLYEKGTPIMNMVNVYDDPTWGPTLRVVPLKDLVAE
jgi:SPP1 gp7 family putative phage head morphogenesis protein